jgi:nucleotide-binding universal stress UspA family protein
VGTDLGPSGARALDVAIGMAGELDRSVHLVCAYAGLPSLDPSLVGSARQAAESMRGRLEQEHDWRVVALAAEAERAGHAGLATSSQLIEGSPQDALIAEAHRLGAACIVVGPHTHRTGPLDRFFGTTAEHVLAHAPCPVLVAPIEPSEAGARLRGRGLLVGIDGEHDSVEALEAALALGSEAGARVEGIYVGDDDAAVDRCVSELRAHAASATEALEPEALDRVLAGVRQVHEDGDVARTLIEAARHADVAMLVLGTGAQRGISRVLKPGLADEVCRASPLPVLVVRAASGGGAT